MAEKPVDVNIEVGGRGAKLPPITGSNIREWDNTRLREEMRMRDPSGWGTLGEIEQDAQMRRMRAKATGQARARVLGPGPKLDSIGKIKKFLTEEPPAGDPRANPMARTIRGLGDLMLPGSYPDVAATLATLPLGGGGGVGVKALRAEGMSLPKALIKSVVADSFKPSSLIKDAGKRALAAGVAGGGTAALMGDKNAGSTAAGYAFSQGLGEALTLPGRLRSNRKVAEVAEAAYQKAVDRREGVIAAQKLATDLKNQMGESMTAARNAFNKSMHGALTDLDKQSVREAFRKDAEKASMTIANHYKKQVGVWKKYPDGEAGIMEMVYGKGPEELSKVFDRGLKNAAAKAKGIELALLSEDVAALNLKGTSMGDALGRPGLAISKVDAGDVVKAIVGKWKENPAMYRRVAAQLDQAGVGNNAARKQYRAGMSLIETVAKNRLMEGGELHPDRVLRALSTGQGNIKPLRGRGQGDYFRGPFAEAARVKTTETPVRVPPAKETFTKAPYPAEPPSPKKGTIERREVPHPWMISTGLASLPLAIQAATTGHAPSGEQFIGHGLGSLAGGLLIPKEIVTKAPLRPGTEASKRVQSAALAQAVRSLTDTETGKKLKKQMKKAGQRLSDPYLAQKAAEDYGQAR